MMDRKNFFLILISFSILNIKILYAEIYVYVDKNGVYHYTNAPTNSKYKPLTNLSTIKTTNKPKTYKTKTNNQYTYQSIQNNSSQYGTLYITIKDTDKGTYKINSQSGVVYKPKTNIIHYSNSGSYIYVTEKPNFFYKSFNYLSYSGDNFISPHKYEAFIKSASYTFSLDPSLIKAVIHAESAGRPDALSPKGAMGLMQLMPGTAKDMSVSNPFDPEDNIWGGSRYLREMLDRFNGDITLALAAYNAGPGAVEKNNGIPPYQETQQYVKRVIGLWKQYKETKNTLN